MKPRYYYGECEHSTYTADQLAKRLAHETLMGIVDHKRIRTLKPSSPDDEEIRVEINKTTVLGGSHKQWERGTINQQFLDLWVFVLIYYRGDLIDVGKAKEKMPR